MPISLYTKVGRVLLCKHVFFTSVETISPATDYSPLTNLVNLLMLYFTSMILILNSVLSFIKHGEIFIFIIPSQINSVHNVSIRLTYISH